MRIRGAPGPLRRTGSRPGWPASRDGNRVTAFATNTAPGGPHTQVGDLELRHRHRARCEDRIRAAKDTGLANLPLQGFDQNRIWCQIVQLACELIA